MSHSQDEQMPEKPIRQRYRVRFGKTGLLRWISHRDLATLWERLVRRAQLKLSMTEGFHPKPRIAFPSALALGVESLDEVVELELAEVLTPAELMDRLVNDQQPGLTIRSVAMLPEGFGKAQLAESHFVITACDGADLAKAMQSIDELLDLGTVTIQRKGKSHRFELASHVPKLDVSETGIELHIANTGGSSLKPTDVLDLLGLDNWIEDGATVVRTRVRLQKEFSQTETEHFVASGLVPEAAYRT